jgi:hypothetical protein
MDFDQEVIDAIMAWQKRVSARKIAAGTQP